MLRMCARVASSLFVNCLHSRCYGPPTTGARSAVKLVERDKPALSTKCIVDSGAGYEKEWPGWVRTWQEIKSERGGRRGCGSCRRARVGRPEFDTGRASEHARR